MAHSSILDSRLELRHIRPMANRPRTIELEANVAEAIESRAAARGVSVSTLIAELVDLSDGAPVEPKRERAEMLGAWAPDVLVEDERRLASFLQTREVVPWDEVAAWMGSWGDADELPQPKPRKI